MIRLAPARAPGAPRPTALEQLLGGHAPRARRSSVLCGLEHEFYVYQGDEKLDFGQVIHTLPIDGRPLDPGDRDAYRSRSGIVIAADTGDAEIALPPVAVRPRFTRELLERSAAGRRELEDLLPGVRLVGATTHFSVSVPEQLVDESAVLYARHFAPALMLIAEPPTSYGVMVRPRTGRLELCTGYVDGSRLQAAAAFAVGSTLAVLASLKGREAGLPPAVEAKFEPAEHRTGVQIRRDGFGMDLYEAGRRAMLRTGDGSILAQEHLRLSLASAERQLKGLAGESDLACLRELVHGAKLLGVEGGDELPAAKSRPARSPFGEILEARVRPGFRVEPALARWEAAVLRLEGHGRTAFAGVPGQLLGRWLAALESGRLDTTISAFLGAPPGEAKLECWCQLTRASLFDTVGNTLLLVPQEHEPAPGAGGGLLASVTAKPRTQRETPPTDGPTGGVPVPPLAGPGIPGPTPPPIRPVVPPPGPDRPGKTGIIILNGHRHEEIPETVITEFKRFSIRTIALILVGIAVLIGGLTGGYALFGGGGGSTTPAADSSPSTGGGSFACFPGLASNRRWRFIAPERAAERQPEHRWRAQPQHRRWRRSQPEHGRQPKPFAERRRRRPGLHAHPHQHGHPDLHAHRPAGDRQ